MASAKRTTKVLRNPRDRTVAYARKQKSPADGASDGGSDADAAEDAASEDRIEDISSVSEAPAAAPTTSGKHSAAASSSAETGQAPAAIDAPAAALDAPAAALDAPAATIDAPAAATIDAPAAAIDAPAAPASAASASAAPAPAVDSGQRARTETIRMPVQTSIGAPPAMPTLPKDAVPAAAAVDTGRAENPTHLPGPREIPAGRPGDPAPPPGLVPSGDSRSMRRRTDVHEFVLIYRMQTHVISRFGVVGTRGQWRVVEYPTSAAASHAYAKECSRFVSDGFSDYREWGGI